MHRNTESVFKKKKVYRMKIMKINRKKDQKDSTVSYRFPSTSIYMEAVGVLQDSLPARMGQGSISADTQMGKAQRSCPAAPRPAPGRGEQGHGPGTRGLASPGSQQHAGRGCICSGLQPAGTLGTALSGDSPRPSFWREVKPRIWSYGSNLKLLKHFTK